MTKSYCSNCARYCSPILLGLALTLTWAAVAVDGVDGGGGDFCLILMEAVVVSWAD